MNWLTLNKDVKESLLIIMKRSLIPIEFSSAYILTMNLESFVSVSITFIVNVVARAGLKNKLQCSYFCYSYLKHHIQHITYYNKRNDIIQTKSSRKLSSYYVFQNCA